MLQGGNGVTAVETQLCLFLPSDGIVIVITGHVKSADPCGQLWFLRTEETDEEVGRVNTFSHLLVAQCT